MSAKVSPRSPPLNIIHRLKNREKKTPDFSELKFFKRIPVFVYGIEQINGTDADIMRGAEYLGRAHTVSGMFYMKAGTYFPIVFPTTIEDPKKGKIRGELYHCSPEHIIALDNANTNGTSFHRMKNRFILEDQSPSSLRSFKDEKFTQAFMYQGDVKYWERSNIRLMPRIVYNTDKKLNHDVFYKWTNKQDEDDIQNDEWGYGGSFWRGEGGNVSNH